MCLVFEGCKQFYGQDYDSLGQRIQQKRDKYVEGKKRKYDAAHAYLTALTSPSEDSDDNTVPPKPLPSQINNIIGYMAAEMTAQEVQDLKEVLDNENEN